MRFHLTGLPGQPITIDNGTCAYTQKVRKFADMMVPRGHSVTIYGDPVCEAAGEHVACWDACDPPEFTPEAWGPFNQSAAVKIAKRAEPGDVLGLIAGRCQVGLAEALPGMFAVEYGIGYGGSFADYRVFESYAWMHTTYGEQRGTNTADGSFYHAVVPAYFNPDEHLRIEGKEDYLLYIGRLEQRKGVKIAEDTAEHLGMDLILAGAGPYTPSYGDTIGVVGPEEKAHLMSRARAVIVPTMYVEPFGCVNVEAQLCGTPVVTTDWGAFTETVEHGVNGYRARTLAEFCEGVRLASGLDGNLIRSQAIERYSLEAVGPMYDAYFEQVAGLKGEGWYAKHLSDTYQTRYR